MTNICLSAKALRQRYYKRTEKMKNKNRMNHYGSEEKRIGAARCADRQKKWKKNEVPVRNAPASVQERVLSALYDHAVGRCLLRPLVSPWFSKLGGWLLDTRLSALAVAPFVRRNHIDLSMCEKHRFISYNDFFTRSLRPEARPVDAAPDAFISPCDARLSVYPITQDGTFCIKHTYYTLAQLLDDALLAQRFDGGTLWLYRLCVDDYHRYIYPADAKKSRQIHIPGIFHTVNPIANDHYPIYKENTREYCLLKTEEFGTLLMMEVGALLVGKIENHTPEAACVTRGEEKGNFAFGGSTIIVLTRKDAVLPDPRFIEQTRAGIETKVRMGERVGERRNASEL